MPPLSHGSQPSELPTSAEDQKTLSDVEVIFDQENNQFDEIVEFRNGVRFNLGHVDINDPGLAVLGTEEQKWVFINKRKMMIHPLARVFAVFGKGRADFFQRRIDEIKKELVNHAPVIAKSSEFGLNFPTGPLAAAAFNRFGSVSSANFALGFGVDEQAKAFVFEFFLDWHSLNVALPVIAEVAVSTNMMVYGADPQRPLVQKGRYFSPWFMPVASIDFPESVNIGYSMGVGLPPIDFLYSYVTNVTRVSLLRVRIPMGAMNKTYRNIETQTAISVVLSRIRSTFSKLRTRVANACSRFLASHSSPLTNLQAVELDLKAPGGENENLYFSKSMDSDECRHRAFFIKCWMHQEKFGLT